MFSFIKKKLRKKYSTIQPVIIHIEKENCLKNRFAVITGGGSGIGFAIAKQFVLSGCKVVITGRNEKKLAEAASTLNELVKNSCFFNTLDIRNTSSFHLFFSELEKEHGVFPDILVNNAGIIGNSNFWDISPDDFDNVLATNLKGPFFLSKEFVGFCISKGIKANILNVGSSSCIRPALTPYSISKWGLRGFTLGLAKKCAKNNIVVNGIAPGPTVTDILGYEISDYKNKSIPSGRFACVEEIASLALKLVSDSSRLILGDMVYITGGAGNLTFDDMEY